MEERIATRFTEIATHYLVSNIELLVTDHLGDFVQ